MSNWRTAEQAAADDNLTEALERVDRAYYEGADVEGILTDYVVVYVRQSFSDEGFNVMPMGVHPRDGDQPLHRTLGLIGYAEARTRAKIAAPELLRDDDDD